MATPTAPVPWPLDNGGKPKRRVRVGGGDRNRNIYWRLDARLEIGYRDSSGQQRWEGPFATLTHARTARDGILGARGRGERVQPNPRLRFGDALDRWLSEQVADLRPATRASYTSYVENHLRPRWGSRRMDTIDVGDAARLVRELRAAGLAEWTIVGIVRAGSRCFKFAARHCAWRGENPFTLLENGERPKPSQTPERRIYELAEVEQMIAATTEPWRTLFQLARVVGPRESELLGLWWEDLELSDLDAATIRFAHQVDREGNRVELKTDESKATLPLPRATAAMLREHKARSLHSGPRAYVFATRSGGPISQRNVLRALYRAQERARDSDGRPTFTELYEHDDLGHLAVDDSGAYVLRRARRRDLDLPDFHALRHTAAMDCDDAEEARDLLRHKNSNVTRAVYRGHFSDRRREMLRAKLEARHGGSAMEATGGSMRQDPAPAQPAEVVDLQHIRSTPQQSAVGRA